MEKKELEPDSKKRKILKILFNDILRIYKTYPNLFKFTLGFVFLIIALLYFKKLSFLIVFLIINEIYTLIEKKTQVSLGLEHGTIVSILGGYYFGIPFGLFASTVIQTILQMRNNKIAIIGVLIDGLIWYMVVIFAALMNSIDIGTVVIILTISRYIVKQIVNVTLGYEIHDALKDIINPIYHIFFIKYLVPLLAFLWL